jgi:hypothetical protein
MRRLLACLTFSLIASGCSHLYAKIGVHPFLVAERRVWCGSSWKLSFYSDGRAEQVTEYNCTRPHHSTRTLWLGNEFVLSLQSRLKQAEFFSLPSTLESDTFAADEDRISITAWSRGLEHSVSVEGLDRTSTLPEVHRFLLVWSAAEAASGVEPAMPSQWPWPAM